MDAQPAAAEPHATAADAVDPMDAAEAAILARDDAGGGTPASKQVVTVAKPAAKPERKGPDIASLATREWKAQQAEKAAKELHARYQPLDEMANKRDLVGVLNHLAEKHGITFADFVAVLNGQDAKPVEKTPAEVAEATARKIIEDDRKAREDSDREAVSKDVEQRIEKFRTKSVEAVENDTTGRWEETAVSGKASEAWDLIDGHFMATSKIVDGKIVEEGEKLTMEQALDLIEKKLKEKRAARLAKKDPGKPKPGAKTGNEAAAKNGDGKAGKPSFTNRRTSGPAPKPVEDEESDDESGGIRAGDDIERAARKANIRL